MVTGESAQKSGRPSGYLGRNYPGSFLRKVLLRNYVEIWVLEVAIKSK